MPVKLTFEGVMNASLGEEWASFALSENFPARGAIQELRSRYEDGEILEDKLTIIFGKEYLSILREIQNNSSPSPVST